MSNIVRKVNKFICSSDLIKFDEIFHVSRKTNTFCRTFFFKFNLYTQVDNKIVTNPLLQTARR